MTSSQILTSGLAGGGFVLLSFLLIYLVWGVRQTWRKQPIVLSQNSQSREAKGFWQLVAQFGDFSQSGDVSPGASTSDAPVPPVINVKRIWLGLILLAVVIAGLAEFGLIWLLKDDVNTNIVLPLFGVVLAGVLFTVSCRKIVFPDLPLPFMAILPQPATPSMTLWVTNLGLTLIVLTGVDVDLPIWANYLILAIWFVNILLFCWNVLQMAHVSLPSQEDVREWWRAHRLEVLIVALIGLAALLVRVIGLETYPYAFVNDEGEVGWEGLNILQGIKSNFFVTGWAGQPMLSFLPVALSIKVFGLTAVAVRILAVLQGTLAVISLYLLAREAFGRSIALFSACFLVALPWQVHFSRLGVMNVGDSFYSATVLWLTYRALRRGRYLDYLLPGLMTGLTLYTYVGSRLVVAMAVGVIGYTIIRQRDYLQTHLRHLAIFIFAFLVVAAPTLYYSSRHLDEFMGRSNEDGLLASNHLQERADAAGIQPIELLARQVQNSTTIFFATSGPNQFLNTPRPYVSWWIAIFLFLGMFYVFWHFKQVRYMMLVGWFWAPVLIGSALTTEPPSHQRMLSAAPALVLIVAVGLWRFAQSLRVMIPISKRRMLAICMVFVGLTALLDLHFYFLGEYRTGHYFEVEGNEFSYEVGLKAGTLGPNYRLLLIGAPYIYSPFADFHYLTNAQMSIEDFNEVTPNTISTITREKGLFFAAIPSRVEELRLVQQNFPGGTWLEVSRHTQLGILYYGYLLPPSP